MTHFLAKLCTGQVNVSGDHEDLPLEHLGSVQLVHVLSKRLSEEAEKDVHEIGPALPGGHEEHSIKA
jgi:hypothetical protein